MYETVNLAIERSTQVRILARALMNEKIIIAGPCAAESEKQIQMCIREAKKVGVKILRASLPKPRSEWDLTPHSEKNFEGLGMEKGLPLLGLISDSGLVPATEVMLPNHAELVINEIVGKRGKEVVVWIGSRNQNHLIQRDIGRAVAGEKRVKLLIKNQPWTEKRHWLGIISHVLAGGASPEQIILCHRGFAPSTQELRNPPNFDISAQIKAESGLPMIGDPSHSAGFSQENVLRMAFTMLREPSTSDGLMIEVHDNPTNAKTDKNQQLIWEQMRAIMHFINNHGQ